MSSTATPIKPSQFDLNRVRELPFTLKHAEEMIKSDINAVKENPATHWESLLVNDTGSKGRPNPTTLVYQYEVDRFYITGFSLEFAPQSYLVRPARVMIFLSHTDPNLGIWQAFDSLSTSTSGAKNMVSLYEIGSRELASQAPALVEQKIDPPRIGKYLIIKFIPFADGAARGDMMAVKRMKIFGFQVPVRPPSTPSPLTGRGARVSVILRDENALWFEQHRKLYFEDALAKGKGLALLLRISSTCPLLRVLLRAHLTYRYGDSGLKERGSRGSNIITGGIGSSTVTYVETFNFGGCNREVNDEVLEVLSSTCKGIKLLNFADCSQASGDKINQLIKSNSGLQSINLSGLTNLTDSTTTTLFENCLQLESFIAWKDISETAVSQLSGLGVLDISNCKNVKDKAFLDIIKNNPLLRFLNISGCEHISDKVFQKTDKDKKLHNLQSLIADCCFGLSGTSFLLLTQSSRSLRTLSLAGNTQKPLNITDEIIASIAQTLGSSLRELNLYRNYQLTDKAVIAVAQNCPNLNVISLAHCKGITDACILELARNECSLQVVNLTNTNITDESVKKLVRHQSRIQILILEWCQKLEDTTVKSIIEHCKNIDTLALTGLYKISDEVLLQLSSLTTLQNLELSWLKKPQSIIDQLRSKLPNTKVSAGEFRSNLSSTFLKTW